MKRRHFLTTTAAFTAQSAILTAQAQNSCDSSNSNNEMPVFKVEPHKNGCVSYHENGVKQELFGYNELSSEYISMAYHPETFLIFANQNSHTAFPVGILTEQRKKNLQNPNPHVLGLTTRFSLRVLDF